MNQYDVAIIGAGPGGIYTAWELTKRRPDLKVAVFESGNPLDRRKCPIDGKLVKACVKCRPCAIMNGFGGAGAFPTASTTSPTTSAARCTNTSAGKRPCR